MRLVNRLLENSLVYRTWQLPFVEQKLVPLKTRGEISRARRVLDVGCGPGTNTPSFGCCEYLGIDINPGYIADARRRYGRRFVVADVTEYSVASEGKFDFILVNSLLHHITDDGVRKLLSHLSSLLSADGHAHIVDILLPERRSIPWMLARLDRGEFPRPIPALRRLVEESFDVVDSEEHYLTIGPLRLWNMAYFKCRVRSAIVSSGSET